MHKTTRAPGSHYSSLHLRSGGSDRLSVENDGPIQDGIELIARIRRGTGNRILQPHSDRRT